MQSLASGRSGRGRRGVEISVARLRQTELDWRNTVLLSLREVADALIIVESVREEIAQNETRATAARESLRLTEMRYRGGVISYVEVLVHAAAVVQRRDRPCSEPP